MSEQKNIETASEFMNFMVDFYSLIRRHIVETNQFRIHSHGFSMLYVLKNYCNKSVTMTELSVIMGITKQQLTKLVNDFEEKGYVRRLRDSENRRLVYVAITQEGLCCLDVMISKIMSEIIRALEKFDNSDKNKIIECSRIMSEIFRRDAGNQLTSGGIR